MKEKEQGKRHARRHSYAARFVCKAPGPGRLASGQQQPQSARCLRFLDSLFVLCTTVVASWRHGVMVCRGVVASYSGLCQAGWGTMPHTRGATCASKREPRNTRDVNPYMGRRASVYVPLAAAAASRSFDGIYQVLSASLHDCRSSFVGTWLCRSRVYSRFRRPWRHDTHARARGTHDTARDLERPARWLEECD